MSNIFSDKTRPASDAIAIVGMSCRFSGVATNTEGLWQMLKKSLTGWTDSASNRFNLDAFWHPQADLSGSFNTRGLHPLKQDPALFDNGFFGIANVEAKAIDPQHRMMLEVAFEAFEDSGIPIKDLAGSETAVYCAISNHDYDKILSRDAEVSPGYRFTGTGPSMLANRVSYFFDLRGPSITLDTACSSGLVAIHEACKSILTGEVKQALVGGANLILDPDQTTVMSSMSFLSPHGRCYSFDSRANGFGRGEGVAAVMLKSLDEALRDGDAIRGIVRGSAISQDGRTPGITMPSCEAQKNMIEKAYERANLNPRDTLYVEAHGTGTIAGDKIEIAALKGTFCRDREGKDLFIGSVKANVGHTENVAGLAGIIKTVLILKNGLIPANPTFSQPSDAIPLSGWNMTFFQVPQKLTPWPEDTVRRASVNSFGYGGTNAHVILEAADSYLSQGVNSSESTRDLEESRPRLYILSHVFESGVGETAANLKRFVANLDGSTKALDSLAYTLTRRSIFEYRFFVKASTQKELLEGLEKQATSGNRVLSYTAPLKVCFAFTGQGAQWAGMGHELLATSLHFSKSMKQCEHILLRIGADWNLIEELCKPENDTRINEAELSQPVCTAIQIGLVDLLASWNITPVGVIGHSSGEIGAAYAAGLLSMEDALKVAYHRGKCVTRLKSLYPDLRGSMLAAGVSATDAQKYLVDDPTIGKAVVACENSPTSVTISGDEIAVSAIQEKLAAKQLFNQKLVVTAAYHSHHMELIQEEYGTSIQDIVYGQRRKDVHMVSSVDGEQVSNRELDAKYWCKNLTSPVRFVNAVTGILEVVRGDEKGSLNIVIVEIGPHSALAGPIKQIVKAASRFQGVGYLSVLSRFLNASDTAITFAGQLFQHGHVGLNIDEINNPYGNAEKRVLSDLPTYSWNHKTRHWSESRRSANYRFRKFPRHDLLGTVSIDSISDEPIWRNYLRLQEQPWLIGHSLSKSIVFPAAGYVAMALEALKQTTLNDAKPWKNIRVSLQDMSFGSALIIPEDSALETLFLLRPHPTKTSWKEFRVFSISSKGESTEHCRGVAKAAPQIGRSRDLTDESSLAFIDDVSKESQMRINPQKLYRDLRAIGLEYTGLFAKQTQIRASESGSVCCVPVPDAQSTMPSRYQQQHSIHPSTLDLCIQSVFPIMKAANLLGCSVVISSIARLEIHSEIPSKPGQELNVATRLRRYGRTKVIGNTVVAHTRNGKSSVFMKINGIVLASSGGPLQPGASARPVGESLTHRFKWSIDPTYSRPLAISARCQLSQTELMSNSPNSICEKYTKIIIQQTLASLDRQKESQIKGHFAKLLQWMRDQGFDAERPTMTEKSDLEAQVKAAGAHGETLVHIAPHLVGVLRGEVDPLDLLRQNDRLYKLYNYENYERGHRQLAKYVQLLQFKNPAMRILEIGAGTASTTLTILDALSATAKSSAGPKLERYTFTDISTGFFEKAEQKLDKYRELVEFKKLDIENSPEQQSFELDFYDLVIATNVLHATRDVQETLKNVRSLLKSTGRLALMEFTVSTLHTGLTFGMLPGWWLSTDGRQGGPLLEVSSWNERLLNSGFSGIDVELPDYSNSEKEMSLLISSASPQQFPASFFETESPTRLSISSISTSSIENTQFTDFVPQAVREGSRITTDSYVDPQVIQVLYGAATDRIADEVSTLLGRTNIPSKKVGLSDLSPDGELVVVLLEFADPFLATCTEKEWQKIREMFQSAAGVLWITTGAAIECSNPMRSLITGLSRCLRSENHTIRFITLDLEIKLDLESTLEYEHNAAVNICDVFQRSLYSYESRSSTEWEYATRGGEILIPRLIGDDEMDSYIQDCVSKFHPRLERALTPGRALGLNIQVPGLLDTLYWADSEKHSRPVGPEEVRVKLEFISLNFKDIMIAMGQLDDHTTLLLEGSGKIIQVGPGVPETFAVGDSVYVRDFDGLATTSNIFKSNIHHVPHNMNLEDSSAVGIAYATALYGLRDMGNLQEGESVLIHSAAGTVGQAGITLAQKVFRAGKIFVTVGSDQKREFIKNKFGIPDENIFSSRGLDFHEAILRQTNNHGVDLVLNSLSGESLQKSVELLAPLGRFIEIGKKDFISHQTALDMWTLEKNIQFSTVDLTLVDKKFPKKLKEIFDTIFDLFTRDKIAIVSPITVQPVSELEEAFRLMQAGKHIGKLVINIDSEKSIQVQPPQPTSAQLNPNSSYLVVGGTGGLGKATLRLLATLGAKRLVTLSRSGSGSKTTQGFIAEMFARGIEVIVHQGSVLDRASIEAVKESCKEYPIKGVVQGAMVLQDTRVEKMEYEQWRTAMDPKVFGTWNIHQVFGNTLDFFILLSSSGGIVGSFSQGNYCAGNTFQDAFARYRGGLGMAGRSINVGFVDGEGYTAENEAASEFVRRQGLTSYKLEEFLVTIEESIKTPIASTVAEAQLLCGISRADPSSQDKEAALQRPDQKFSHIWRKAVTAEQTTTTPGQIDFQAALRTSTSAEEASRTTLDAIRAKLARLLAVPVEEIRSDRSIASNGMDSLIAIELRNWILTSLEAHVQMFELMSSISFFDLALVIAKRSRLIPSDLFAKS